MSHVLPTKHKRKCALLGDRAAMLGNARAFFSDRNVIEVDCPAISLSASIDLHIDPICIKSTPPRYLHTSPEHAMKRLLAEGMGDIYQISHVFREGEAGSKHNPEFSLVEWYRIDISFQEMIDETALFIELFINEQKREQLTYQKAFIHYCGLDPLISSPEQLLSYIQTENIDSYKGMETEGKDALLNLILAKKIEPHLGKDCLTTISHYPASQAALAQIVPETGVAERFEIYFQGVELANGYHELHDASEQRTRYCEENHAREMHGKKALPLDEKFLSALETGMPDCCGVAVGFDRLMMLRNGTETIADILPFDWETA